MCLKSLYCNYKRVSHILPGPRVGQPRNRGLFSCWSERLFSNQERSKPVLGPTLFSGYYTCTYIGQNKPYLVCARSMVYICHVATTVNDNRADTQQLEAWEKCYFQPKNTWGILTFPPVINEIKFSLPTVPFSFKVSVWKENFMLYKQYLLFPILCRERTKWMHNEEVMSDHL